MKRNINIFKKLLSPSFGFTLVELIVVIAIVSALAVAALAILNPSAQFQKANDSKRKADLSQIQKALESYYQDNGTYPAQSVSGNTINGASWGSPWGIYMNVVPKDPKASNKYIYVTPDGQSYYLYANLERGSKDPQACNAGLACARVPAGVNCGGICNYGVSTPNTSP